MPKPRKLQDEIYNYILAYFENRHIQTQQAEIKRNPTHALQFPSITSIENLVLSDPRYIETTVLNNPDEEPDQPTSQKNKINITAVSRGTIRKAAQALIKEGKISLVNGSYEFTPNMQDSLDKFPILKIADSIDISIGIPEAMLVLSVKPEYAMGITDYLSALFYKKDIIFIPIHGIILCIAVLPKNVLNNRSAIESHEKATQRLHQRIALAIHQFNTSHPDFHYTTQYDFSYHCHHNPDIIKCLTEDFIEFKNPSNSITLRVIQDYAAALEYAFEPSYNDDDAIYNTEEFEIGEPTAEDLDLWDLPDLDEDPETDFFD